MTSLADARIEAKRAEARATKLRAEANAKKAAAEFEQEWGSGEGSDATAKAWDAYQDATNAAARAEKEAEVAQHKVERTETEQALSAAVEVKVRDYMLVDDIAEQAMEIPAGTTFGDLIDIAIEAMQEDTITRAAAADAAAEWLEDQVGGFDTEARNKIANATEKILDRCHQAEIYPLSIL